MRDESEKSTSSVNDTSADSTHSSTGSPSEAETREYPVESEFDYVLSIREVTEIEGESGGEEVMRDDWYEDISSDDLPSDDDEEVYHPEYPEYHARVFQSVDTQTDDAPVEAAPTSCMATQTSRKKFADCGTQTIYSMKLEKQLFGVYRYYEKSLHGIDGCGGYGTSDL